MGAGAWPMTVSAASTMSITLRSAQVIEVKEAFGFSDGRDVDNATLPERLSQCRLLDSNTCSRQIAVLCRRRR